VSTITTTSVTEVAETPEITSGEWQLDPTRSSVEFHVPHFYGVMTVKGHFDRYQGTLSLEERPALELTIDADSLETKHGKRDAHLRSGEFFDVANHPHVRFVADAVTLHEDTLSARGELHAAGRQVPLNVEATVRQIDREYEVEATALVDHRELGMTWSPLGILRAPNTLIVRGRLVNGTGAQ
jgi:polyisoprenoid-binding protein YceI